MNKKTEIEVKDQADMDVDFLGMRVLTPLEEEGVAFAAGDHDHDHVHALAK